MSAVNPTQAGQVVRKHKKRRWSRDDTELSLLALPTTIWYFLFCYLPMFGIILPFLNFRIQPGKNFFESLIASPFKGLDNFKYLFMGTSKNQRFPNQ